MAATDMVEPGGMAARTPRLAVGTELIGPVAGSGLREPPYLVGRPDGQIVQLSHLLFLVAAGSDGRSDEAEIAARLSRELARPVSPGNVRYLLDEKLAPLGLLDGSAPAKRVEPLLGLRFRVGVVPPRVVDAIGRLLSPLFWPPIVCAVIAVLAWVDVWLLTMHGLGASVAGVIYQPTLLLGMTAAMVLSLAFHELGHAAACRYGGVRPGTIGVGIYLIWPAFYTDLTSTYRLGRIGRLRADLGGVYFNAIVALAAAGAYLVTRFEPVLLMVVIAQLQILDQFVPWLRLDGYYVVSDLIGVSDLFARIRPVLRSLLPRRPPDPRVRELRPWARAAVTVWVLTAIPLLAGLLAFVVYHAPRMVAMSYDSLLVQVDGLVAGLAGGRLGEAMLRALAAALLIAPVVGLALNAGAFGARAVRALARR